MGALARIASWFSKRNPAITTPIEREWLAATWTFRELGAVTAKRPREDQRTLVLRAAGYVNICAGLIADYCGTVPIRLYQKRTRRSGKPKAAERRKYKRLCDPSVVGLKASMYAEAAGDVQEVEDSDALAFIRNPNGNDTGVEFWSLHRWYKCVVGNAYWLVASDGNQPVSMRHLLPQNTAILPAKTGRLIDGYAYGREQTNIEVFQPEDVLHFKLRPSPFDPYYGVGKLHAITVEADVLTAARNLDLIRITNGMRPDSIVQMPRGTSPDQQKALYDRLYERHRGPNNAMEPLITAGDEIKVTPLSWTDKEAETSERDKRVRKVVWDSFGMCGMLDESGASIKIGSDGKSDAERMFLRQTCNPILVGDAETMTIGLLPRFGINPGEQWFAADDACGEDEAALETRMIALVDKAILSMNEARERIGYEPVEEGDDLRYAGTSLETLDNPPQPMASLGNERPTPQDEGDAGDSGGDKARRLGIEREGNFRGCPEVSMRSFVCGGIEKTPTGEVVRALLECASCGTSCHAKPDSQARVKSLPENIPGEDAIHAAVGQWVRNITVNVTTDGVTLDAEKTAAQFVAYMGDKFLLPMGAGWDAGARALPTPTEGRSLKTWAHLIGRFTADNPTARAKVQAHTIRLSHQVTDTVQKQLQNAIAEQLESGAPLTELQAEIQEIMGGISKTSAERIARTETARAYSRGSIEAWDESGVVVGKKWDLAPGACPLCEAMSKKFGGKKATPLDKPFIPLGGSIVADGVRYVMDYAAVDGPPAHPQCRCSLTPVLEGE